MISLIQIIEEAGSHVEAVGIVIEKSFQDGRALLEEAGYPVVSASPSLVHGFSIVNVVPDSLLLFL